MRLITFGHGTASSDQLATLIIQAGIHLVVDVRTVPKSARHPQFRREELEEWIPRLSGAAYRWEKDLGGFRKPRPDSANIALRNLAFRGYADYMETPPFKAALKRLLDEAREQQTAIMCSESLWWRCHRRLVGDAAQLLYGLDVQDLLHTGKMAEHVPTGGVRVLNPSELRYDLGNDDQPNP